MGTPHDVIATGGHRWAFGRPPPDIRPSVVSAHSVQWPAGYQNDDQSEVHFYWTLDYFTSRGVEIRYSPTDTWGPRRPYVFMLHAPKVPFWQRTCRADTPFRAAYISIRDTEATGLETLLPVRRPFAEFEDPERILGSHMETMIEVGERRRNAGYLEVQALLMHVLEALFAAEQIGEGLYRVRAKYDRGPSSPLAVKVREYVGEHLAEPITLEDIARHLKMSVSALTHNYRKVVGETPMQTLTRARIWMAKRLLSYSGLSQEEIASRTGFCDTSHLARRFKQIEGITPGEFVRNGGFKQVSEGTR